MTKVLAIAVVLLSGFMATAQTRSRSIVTKSLDRTAFWVQPNLVSASSSMCDGCFALTPLFNVPGLVGLRCLQPAGTKCIYHISVESTITLASHDFFPITCLAAIRILVDGHAATPGPGGTSGPGTVPVGGELGVFEETVSPTSPPPSDFRPHTVSTIAVVTNTVANQLHSITIDLYASGDGVATASGSIATIQVYH
jgi:hypothetical protein